jgi:hypothetical protein
LDYRDGDMTGFAGVDVPDEAGFASMNAANHFASCAVA